ncbi:MAG: hypothetical protein ACPGLV_01835 [Bacteroidia bacterium]
MKREIIVSVLLLAGIVAGSIYYFTSYAEGDFNASIENAIPEETIVVLDLEPCFNDLEGEKNELLASFLNDSLVADLQFELDFWQRKDTTIGCELFKNGIAALTRVNSKQLGWLIALEQVDVEILQRKLGIAPTLLDENRNGIFEFNGKKWHFIYLDNMLVLSRFEVIIDGANESLKKESITYLAKRWAKGEHDILINYNLLPWFIPNGMSQFQDQVYALVSPLKGIGTYQVTKTDKELNLFGSVSSTSSSGVFNTENFGAAKQLGCLNIIPSNAAFFWAEPTVNFEANIRRNKLNAMAKAQIDSFEKAHQIDIIENFASHLSSEYVIASIGAFNHRVSATTYAAIRVNNIEELTAGFNSIDTNSKSDTMGWGQLKSSQLLLHLFGESAASFTSPYFAFKGDFLFFSDSKNVLSTVFRSIDSEKVLAQKLAFEQVVDWTSDKCNLVFYVNPKLSYTIPRQILSNTGKEFYARQLSQIESIDHFVFQLVKTEKEFFNHIFIKQGAKKLPESSVLFVNELEANISAGPFTVTNYHTRKNEMMVVDDNGKVYQINKANEVVWNYVVNGKLTSEPFEIDAFNNNKLQYLIPTSQALYLIDRKGRPVSGYPVNLAAVSNATTAVFDLNADGNNELYVPCKSGKLFGYNYKGLPLPKWSPMNLDADAVGEMQYFKKSGKSYYFSASKKGTIYLWHSNAKQAIAPIKTNTRFKSNFTLQFGKQLTDCKLLAIDSTGNLIKTKLDGSISKLKIKGFNNPNGFWAQVDGKSGKELLIWENQNFQVLDQSLVVKLSLSLAYKIDKVQTLIMPSNELVFAVHTNNNQLQLYTSQGELLRFEPFESNSKSAALIDIDDDGAPELVTGLDNKLIVYKNIN